ncbi:MAG: insulinase family protein [Gammaproteobacteria bacterium]|nr:MAG: insulinase family protein [Gammaproteobacteria bacterium]
MKYFYLIIFFISLNLNANTDQKVHQFILKNGMKILVQEDNRSAVVVSQVWYKVGSTYEHNGITGVSHALEHMMFKGTKKYKAGEFSKIIAKAGGKENAFTSRDYTAYFQRISNDKLELCLKLEADRMKNIQLTNKEFKKEMEVIKEERRMRTDDKPRALASELFLSTAFVSSPIRNPVIGWMNDIETLTKDDLQQWYDKYYAPNNATLVVVGNVKAKKVYKLAKKYFGKLKKQKIPQPKPRLEIEQNGTKLITIYSETAKLPYLQIGYKVPSLKNIKNHKDVYALEVLAYILDGGSSARFSKNLIRGSELAASVNTSYNPNSRLNSLFDISAIPTEKTSIEKLHLAIDKQIQQVKDGDITKEEMNRIKNTILAEKIYALDSAFYQAMQIGISETVGLGYQTFLEYPQKIQQITAKQVTEVAKKYLIDKNKTVAILYPVKSQ